MQEDCTSARSILVGRISLHEQVRRGLSVEDCQGVFAKENTFLVGDQYLTRVIAFFLFLNLFCKYIFVPVLDYFDDLAIFFARFSLK